MNTHTVSARACPSDMLVLHVQPALTACTDQSPSAPSPLTITRHRVLTQLEPAAAACAHVVTVHRACRARCWRAVRAHTSIRVTRGFVPPDLPSRGATGHETLG